MQIYRSFQADARGHFKGYKPISEGQDDIAFDDLVERTELKLVFGQL
jgi:hypothetical protein